MKIEIDLATCSLDLLKQIAISSKDKETLRELAKHEKWEIRETVAKNTSAPEDVLRSLGLPFDITAISVAVARNVSTPEDVLEELSLCPIPDIVIAVAGNPSTPLRVLKNISLKSSTTWEISEVIAKNPNADIDLLINLAAHPYYPIRKAVASNSKILESKELVNILYSDSEDEVKLLLLDQLIEFFNRQ